MTDDDMAKAILEALAMAATHSPEVHYDLVPMGEPEQICRIASRLRGEGLVEGSIASDAGQTAVKITVQGLDYVRDRGWGPPVN